MNISEIAKLAGVSPAAVSRYINGGSISEEKKQKIKKVIEETGYVPNLTARSLRQQRSDNIGIIVPRINSDSVSNLIEGVLSILNQSGYMTIFGNTENNEKREIEYIRMMQETKLAGVILMGTVFTNEHNRIFRDIKMPIVVCGQNHPLVNCIYHDDKNAAKAITSYMIKKGRRRLAYVGVTETDICVGLNRRLGVEEAMTEAGLDASSLVRTEGFFNAKEGYENMKKILDGGFVPDGVVCATDTLAAGVMKALREKGYSIPADVSVGGIGGGTAGNIMYPSLTTVKLFHRESGERAAFLLLSIIRNNREEPERKLPVTHTKLGYELIERESV